MDDLADLRDAVASMASSLQRRNELIVAARRDGWPWANIAEAAGVTRQHAQLIARTTNGGVLPKPKE